MKTVDIREVVRFKFQEIDMLGTCDVLERVKESFTMCKDIGMEFLRIKGKYVRGIEIGERYILSDLGDRSWALVEVGKPLDFSIHHPDVVWVKDIDCSHLEVAEFHKRREKKEKTPWYPVYHGNLYGSLEEIRVKEAARREWWEEETKGENKVARGDIPNPEW